MDVAVKTVRKKTKFADTLMQKEMDALCKIKHDNIVRYHRLVSYYCLHATYTSTRMTFHLR